MGQAARDSDEVPVWFYRINDQQMGPATTAELKRDRLRSSRSQDFVWKEGLTAWSAVQDTAELSIADPLSQRSCNCLNRGSIASATSCLGRLVFRVPGNGLGVSLYLNLAGKLGTVTPVSTTSRHWWTPAISSIEGIDAERVLAIALAWS